MDRLSFAIGAIGMIVFSGFLAAWRIAYGAAERDRLDDASDQIPHGDIVRLPIGAAYRSRVNSTHSEDE